MEASVIALGTNVSKTGLSSGLKMICLQGYCGCRAVSCRGGANLTGEIYLYLILGCIQRSSNTVLFSYYFHCPIYNFIERHYTEGEARLTCARYGLDMGKAAQDHGLDICLICTIRCHMADSAAAAPGDGGILDNICLQLNLKMSFIITLKQRPLALYSLLCWDQTQLLHRPVSCM